MLHVTCPRKAFGGVCRTALIGAHRLEWCAEFETAVYHRQYLFSPGEKRVEYAGLGVAPGFGASW